MVDFSLKPDSERPLTRPDLRSPGNYYITAIHAGLFQLDQAGNLEASRFNQGAGNDRIPLVLFMNDFPALVEGGIIWDQTVEFPEDGGGVVPVPGYQIIPGASVYGDGTVLALVWVAGDHDVGEAASGVTVTNGLTVTGYPVLIAFPDYSIQVDGADVDPMAVIFAIANGAVIDGPIGTGGGIGYNGAASTGGPGGAAFPNVTSVILLESDYTAAMQANNNVYVAANGTIVHIVGLHAIPALA